MDRVRLRGKDYEAAMTIDYLRELCGIYEEFFHHYDDTPLLILDTDEFDYRSDPAELSRVCDLVLETLNRHISAEETASIAPQELPS